MPPKRKSNDTQGSDKKPRLSLPPIPWAENDAALTWSLIGELEKPENFKVLFGKRDNSEVCNSGLSLLLWSYITVFVRIYLVNARARSINELQRCCSQTCASLMSILSVIGLSQNVRGKVFFICSIFLFNLLLLHKSYPWVQGTCKTSPSYWWWCWSPWTGFRGFQQPCRVFGILCWSCRARWIYSREGCKPMECVYLLPHLSSIFLHYDQRKLRRTSSSFHGCMPCLQPNPMSILQWLLLVWDLLVGV